MFRAETKLKIEEEISEGEKARREGHEGRARVCARRAAGAAIREYFRLRGVPGQGPSAYDLLNQLQALPDLPAGVRGAASRLVERVREDFSLPSEVDLLADARNLAQELEKRVGEA